MTNTFLNQKEKLLTKLWLYCTLYCVFTRISAHCSRTQLTQRDRLTDWYAWEQNNLKPLLPLPTYTNTVMWLCRSVLQAQSASAVKEHRGGWASGARGVSVRVTCSRVGVLSSPPVSDQPPLHPPGQDLLHLFTLLSDLKPQGQKI